MTENGNGMIMPVAPTPVIIRCPIILILKDAGK